jgi:hypothetical protein
LSTLGLVLKNRHRRGFVRVRKRDTDKGEVRVSTLQRENNKIPNARDKEVGYLPSDRASSSESRERRKEILIGAAGAGAAEPNREVEK